MQVLVRNMKAQRKAILSSACENPDDLYGLQSWLKALPRFNMAVERGTRDQPIIGLGYDADPEHDGHAWISSGQIVCSDRRMMREAMLLVGVEIARRVSMDMEGNK